MAMLNETCPFDITHNAGRGLRRCTSKTPTISTVFTGITKTPTTPPTTPCRNRRVHFDTPRSRQSSSSSASTSITSSSTQPAPSMDTTRPKVLGIHHLKFAVSNLDVSIAWYERVLGGRRVPGLDHTRQDGTRFAAILEMVDWGGLYLELRQTSPKAQRDRGWDPVTLTVRGRKDLEVWVEWLERWGTVCSGVLVGVRGWILVFEDPDGRRFRIYTKEDHGGKIEPSSDAYWLAESP